VKHRVSIFCFGFAAWWITGFSPALAAEGSVNVIQEHNNLSRDGVFVDAAFTAANPANLTRELNFDGTIVGSVYAQPLYVEDGPGGGAMVIAVTESNNVYALDATTGNIIWERNGHAGLQDGSPLWQHRSSRHYRHTCYRSWRARCFSMP
jgi:outer membrane protein assembly factor BamB